jgi:2-oxoglutarate ferredoxin oxidoreductase subunit beta
MSTTETPNLKAKDFKSDQEVRWCPGCGDYGILNAVQKLLRRRSACPREHGLRLRHRLLEPLPVLHEHLRDAQIHGRAPAIATGVKVANPDLDVWVITGDGDGLSIGGNHLIHALRRTSTSTSCCSTTGSTA